MSPVPLGDASALLALYQALEKHFKDKAALSKALEDIKSVAHEIFPIDSNFVLQLLQESQSITSELVSRRLDKRSHLIQLFRDAYNEAPGLAWSKHHEYLVEQFATKVSEILLGYGVNEVPSSTDYLDSRAQERHEETQVLLRQSASDTNEGFQDLRSDLSQLRDSINSSQQTRQSVDNVDGSLRVRRLPN